MKTMMTLMMALSSVNAFAATADIAGTLKAFKVAGKVLCRDVTPMMGEANIKAGINILILLSQAEDFKKAGKLEEAAAAEGNIEKIMKASQDLSAQYNSKCVAETAVFAESAGAESGSGGAGSADM
jgi:hypothetical protein